MTIRHGEESATHFRSERIECMNGSWYIAVRETWHARSFCQQGGRTKGGQCL